MTVLSKQGGILFQRKILPCILKPDPPSQSFVFLGLDLFFQAGDQLLVGQICA
jgi:hypothetical protein